MKQKILITGSTGFIGSNIINLLLKKDVYIYDVLRNKNKKNKKIRELKKNKNYLPIFYRKFDELEKKLKKIKIDTVINCAAYYTSKNDIKNIENLVRTNIIFCSITSLYAASSILNSSSFSIFTYSNKHFIIRILFGI